MAWTEVRGRPDSPLAGGPRRRPALGSLADLQGACAQANELVQEAGPQCFSGRNHGH